jgi:hypothetical protein
VTVTSDVVFHLAIPPVGGLWSLFYHNWVLQRFHIINDRWAE